MSEIILCNRNFNASTFKNECGIDLELISSLNCANPSTISANKPYILNGNNTSGVGALRTLSHPEISSSLTNLSLSFGGDNIVALSSIHAKLQEFNVGVIGASSSTYANRMGGFVGSVKEYQSALMTYRGAVKANSAAKGMSKQKAKLAFDKMQKNFRQEINILTSQVKSSRGTPMTSFKRGTDIARSSRTIAKLNLTNQVQASNVVKLTRQAKFLGNGLAVIDYGSRIGNIHNSYKAGGNWEREMFIESTGFITSAATGSAVLNVGGAALTFLMVATPVGWVGLIVGGVAVAGTAAVASIAMNDYSKQNSGSLYDGIMSWINN